MRLLQPRGTLDLSPAGLGRTGHFRPGFSPLFGWFSNGRAIGEQLGWTGGEECGRSAGPEIGRLTRAGLQVSLLPRHWSAGAAEEEEEE